MSDDADRSIPATPRRREAARREGLVPSAAPLAWSAAALTTVALLPAWVRATVPAATDMLRRTLDPSRPLTPLTDVATGGVVLPAVGLVLATAVVGLGVHVACDGFAWEPGRFAPRLSRVDPVRGLARIFSLRTLLAAVGSGMALASLVGAAAVASSPLLGAASTPALDGDPTRAALAAWRALAALATAGVVVGAIRYALARRRFETRIRMTPEEFADELKSLQADPKVRLARHGARR